MKILELMEQYGWRILTDCDGSCPCGEGYVGGIHIRTHCWRSVCPERHKYSCVHVWGNHDFWLESENKNKAYLKQVANLIAKDIRDSWETEVAISFKGEKE